MIVNVSARSITLLLAVGAITTSSTSAASNNLRQRRASLFHSSGGTTKNAKKKQTYLKNFEIVREKLKQVEEADRIRNWQPPIDGATIRTTFQIGPGPEIGQIKNAIREAILEGDIPNEHAAAFGFMIEKGESLGLKPKKS